MFTDYSVMEPEPIIFVVFGKKKGPAPAKILFYVELESELKLEPII